MPYDLDSFDEVEASEGDFDSIHSEYGIALADAQTAILKSEELCKRYDPDDEPYKSKYLAREALKIAILKLQPHTEKNASISKESRTIARDTVARLNWRLAAIYMGKYCTNFSLLCFFQNRVARVSSLFDVFFRIG
jgi:hypothetical protein